MGALVKQAVRKGYGLASEAKAGTEPGGISVEGVRSMAERGENAL